MRQGHTSQKSQNKKEVFLQYSLNLQTRTRSPGPVCSACPSSPTPIPRDPWGTSLFYPEKLRSPTLGSTPTYTYTSVDPTVAG